MRRTIAGMDHERAGRPRMPEPATRRRLRTAGVWAAVVATAAAGSAGVRTDTRWYRELDKPPWQPPPVAFPVAWTTLYALIAVAGSRAVNRAGPAQRRPLARGLLVNLVLNAGWCWVFFRARRPDAALGVIAALDASTVALIRRSRRVDGTSAALLAPYAAWTGFATALNASIATRNR